MHRHSYRGRKLGRERDERRKLLKNLATSLILEQEIVTTFPKAKEVLPYTERLITKAKKGGLHNRRHIISALLREDAAHKLVDEIAPQLSKRDSGFLRLRRRVGLRSGDGSELASVSFVDELTAPEANQEHGQTTSKNVSTLAKKKIPAKKPTNTAKVKTAKAASK